MSKKATAEKTTAMSFPVVDMTRRLCTCVCEDSVELLLQKPHFEQISWAARCSNCHWFLRVSVTL